jgi:prepilin-type N-terminal cleavage/methylation domain-containing protein
MKFRKGFSLIELLVVIAIIGILAAIIFPVFARAKDSAYRTSDMSNMNAIRSALQLYRTDQGAYPPSLFGYATMYDGSTTNLAINQVIPADQVAGALFPKRVSGLETFRPAYDRPMTTDFNQQFVETVWPSSSTINSSAGQPAQRFGPDTQVTRCASTNPTTGEPFAVMPRYFYKASGYDYGTVKFPGGERNELRYTLFWTGWSVPTDPCNVDPNTEQGSGTDNPRQLGYSDPPDTTLITWNSWFREYDSNNNIQGGGKRDIALFLGGSARMVDSQSMATQAYAFTP